MNGEERNENKVEREGERQASGWCGRDCYFQRNMEEKKTTLAKSLTKEKYVHEVYKNIQKLQGTFTYSISPSIK